MGSYDGSTSIDKKTERSGWYINVDGGKRYWNNVDYKINQTVENDGYTYKTAIRKTMDNGHKQLELETGFNYDITKKDYIDVSFSMEPIKNSNFSLYNGWVTSDTYRNGSLQNSEDYNLISSYKNKYGYYGGYLSYNHFFNEDKSHKLIFEGSISNYMNPYTESTIDSKEYDTRTVKIGSDNYEKNELLLTAKITYEIPFSEKTNLNGGFDVNVDDIPEIGTENGTYDENGVLTPFSNQRSKQIIDYNRSIYSGFANFTSAVKKFEYKAGLRLEYEQTNAN